MVRLLLDADQVVVGVTVSTGMMLGLNGGASVPHHQIQHGDGTTQSRKSGQEIKRQEARCAFDVPTHRCLIAVVRRDLRNSNHISNKVYSLPCQRLLVPRGRVRDPLRGICRPAQWGGRPALASRTSPTHRERRRELKSGKPPSAGQEHRRPGRRQPTGQQRRHPRPEHTHRVRGGSFRRGSQRLP